MSIDAFIRSILLGLVSFLAWQIFVDANRITAIERDQAFHEKYQDEMDRRLDALEQHQGRAY